jgi:amino acid transporter
MSSTVQRPAGHSSASGADEMHAGSIGFVGLLTQSVASVGPSFAIAALLGLVATNSGPAAWLVWALSALLIIAIALCITQFTRRFVTTGGLYSLSAQGGKGLGLLAAWAYALFGIVTAPALPVAFGVFLNDFIVDIGGPGGTGLVLLWGVLAVVIASALAWKDVGLSATVMLVVELISVAAIVVLMVIVLANNTGSLFDSTQLGLKGVTVHDITLGIVIGLLAYAGFESATFLGREAKAPQRQISRALIGSVTIIGVLFIFCTYCMTIGLGGSKAFGASENPLRQLAVDNNVEALRYIVQFGVVMSLFGVVTANVNFVSRMLLTLSRERLFPAPLARVDHDHGTPVAGIIAVAAIDIVTGIVLALTGRLNLQVFFDLGTIGGYWVGATYLVTCVAVVAYLRRTGELTPLIVLTAAVGGLPILYLYYRNASPWPPVPGSTYLLVFFGTAVVAFAHLIYAKARRSPVLDQLGSSVEEDTLAAGRSA